MAMSLRPHFGILLAASVAIGSSTAHAFPASEAPALLDPSIMCVAQASLPAVTSVWSDADLVLGARAAWAAGRLDDARAMLDEAARRFPRITDHVSVMLGEIELEAGDAAAALSRFEAVRDTASPSLRLEARVGRVRALLELGHREGNQALEALLSEYPELPEAERLTFARGISAERRERFSEAVAAYRELDLECPGSLFANEARARLAALLSAGVEVRPYSLDERVERAGRLVSTGPTQAARETVDALLAEEALTSTQRRTLLRLAIRIARFEGRFGDLETLEASFRALGRGKASRASALARSTPAEEETEATASDATASADPEDGVAETPSEDSGENVDSREQRARAEIARLLRGRAVSRTPAELLDEVADHAAGGALDETLRIVIERAKGDDIPGETRFAVAMAASARPGFEDAALSLLSGLGSSPADLATAARYHRARLLERLGRLTEARELFESVIAADRSSGRYYTLWTNQRLEAVNQAIAAREAADSVETTAANSHSDAGTALLQLADAGVRAASFDEDRGGRTFDLEAEAIDLPESVDVDALAIALDEIAPELEATYPWIGRAADLLRVRAIEEARSELFEVLVAHRLSSGRGVHRYGLEAVGRGVSQSSRPAARRGRSARAPARPNRRPLEDSARGVLADVAAALGDHGTAIALGGTHSADARPRAFAVEVVSAARQFGVDPNLLWAVMRVESVYQPRIVSYAGAIGLMQIMPRTGRLIAQRLGRNDFTTAKLLDPSTNLEFAAWYLHSLIERFDGDLPLAIAAYNGGPHNVRVWLERMGPTVPLDAFLERIPFDQTHRYVRRVLTHYAAYRARDGLPMIELDLSPPPNRLDSVAF